MTEPGAGPGSLQKAKCYHSSATKDTPSNTIATNIGQQEMASSTDPSRGSFLYSRPNRRLPQMVVRLSRSKGAGWAWICIVNNVVRHYVGVVRQSLSESVEGRSGIVSLTSFMSTTCTPKPAAPACEIRVMAGSMVNRLQAKHIDDGYK